MPKPLNVPFDFIAWRERLGWSKEQAQIAFGISRTYYWRLERDGCAQPVYAWAAYGLECYEIRKGKADGN